MTRDEVNKALAGGFDLVSQKDMPFLIREHQRKYQIGYGQLSFCVCLVCVFRVCVSMWFPCVCRVMLMGTACCNGLQRICIALHFQLT